MFWAGHAVCSRGVGGGNTLTLSFSSWRSAPRLINNLTVPMWFPRAAHKTGVSFLLLIQLTLTPLSKNSSTRAVWPRSEARWIPAKCRGRWPSNSVRTAADRSLSRLAGFVIWSKSIFVRSQFPFSAKICKHVLSDVILRTAIDHISSRINCCLIVYHSGIIAVSFCCLQE